MGIANAFFGTKLILNGDLHEVNSYKERYLGQNHNLIEFANINFGIQLNWLMEKTPCVG